MSRDPTFTKRTIKPNVAASARAASHNTGDRPPRAQTASQRLKTLELKRDTTTKLVPARRPCTTGDAPVESPNFPKPRENVAMPEERPRTPPVVVQETTIPPPRIESASQTPNTSTPSTPHSMERVGSQQQRRTPSQVRKSTRVRLCNTKVLGKGTWGTVYVGLNEATREIIAVKEVIFTNREEIEQTAREITLMKKLDHPNIVKYLGADREGNTLKIYMEYIVGGSLASLLKSFGPFTELMCAGYCMQILDGLAYLHSKNIAHRDIKCDNLLVEKTGDVKLADFGQAKEASETLKSITGTAFFMAPEVIRGERYTLAADIWSFGCAVIEMMTGRPPYSTFGNQYAAMYHITHDNPRDQIPRHLSKKAQEFIARCLQVEPEDRPEAGPVLMEDPFLDSRRASIAALRTSPWYGPDLDVEEGGDLPCLSGRRAVASPPSGYWADELCKQLSKPVASKIEVASNVPSLPPLVIASM
eukprot:TRINITY_DN81373_c0_g1_i1.p1 TRINITY_DN81373_c0_g1~~TRINITY_DN81373_c0_g1_i1.p1  ORF type:complete len:474 (-),score=52.56 TRINITY_DN81373_c0_g1_i1:53-1474(-)